MQQNPIKCIRLKCLNCSNNSTKEVELCNVTNCAIYPFRFGTNPYRTKMELSPERRKELSDRMKKLAADKKASKSAKTVTS